MKRKEKKPQFSKWRDKHGNTVDVIHIAHEKYNKVSEWGQWLVAKRPNGQAMAASIPENATPDEVRIALRGWVRTMPELGPLGVDLASLKEIKVHGGSTMFVAEAMLKTARGLNEPGEALDNFEYVRGQAELLVDSLGYSMDEAKYAIMAYLAHMINFGDLMDILYERGTLSDEIVDKIDKAHHDYMRGYVAYTRKVQREKGKK